VLASFVALVCIAHPGFGFHNGGVGSCQACHVMHDSRDGLSVALFPSGEPGLLLEETASDVCLRCHASESGAVFSVNPQMPAAEKGGGNFIFLLEENLNDAPDGASILIPGDAAGHNLDAPGHGLASDTRHSLSPGGSFPAGELGCTSCHDPHGNANFRLLHGAGPVQGGIAVFSFPAPEAEGVELETESESNSLHTAYQRGLSDWCGNCHGRYHDDTVTAIVPGGGEPLEHPSDRPLNREARDQYNRYNGDDDPLGGSQAVAYLAAVPFEDAANTTTSTLGPGGGARVMCLTCHRAHATSAPAAGRWDFRVGLLSEDGVVSGSYPIPDPFSSPNQGRLCSKCHEGGAASSPEAPGILRSR
jgi:predicted CXXCH cytochrome family protein